MATGYNCGHPIWYDHEHECWRYMDTLGRVDDTPLRVCPKCGHMPTPEGHDACLGTIPGATSACCGHGIYPGYVNYADGRCEALPLAEGGA